MVNVGYCLYDWVDITTNAEKNVGGFVDYRRSHHFQCYSRKCTICIKKKNEEENNNKIKKELLFLNGLACLTLWEWKRREFIWFDDECETINQPRCWTYKRFLGGQLQFQLPTTRVEDWESVFTLFCLFPYFFLLFLVNFL